ncbi:MAG TPA: hypothetical protein VF446_17085 [Trinickia sp.]
MANANSTRRLRDATATTKAGVQPLDLGELTIIMLYDYQYSEYWGTRAQLEAEGVIPDDFEWPEGFNSAYWQSGPFDFWLRQNVRRERKDRAGISSTAIIGA